MTILKLTFIDSYLNVFKISDLIHEFAMQSYILFKFKVSSPNMTRPTNKLNVTVM